jgi:soluble lytic murein transglycosylase-like protein
MTTLNRTGSRRFAPSLSADTVDLRTKVNAGQQGMRIIGLNQRMGLVLLMTLFAIAFMLLAQPESEVRSLPILELVLQPVVDMGAQVALSQESSSAELAVPITGNISPVFTDEVRYWEQDILRWADNYSLDPNLVAIIMQVESCGDPQAGSYAGAQGLFQVMPFHFSEGEDSFDPETNARRGIDYFVGRMEQTGGDLGRSFAGYNGGHVAAASHWDDWALETQSYYIWTTGIYDDIQSGRTDSPTLQRWLQAGGASLCQQASDRLGLHL